MAGYLNANPDFAQNGGNRQVLYQLDSGPSAAFFRLMRCTASVSPAWRDLHRDEVTGIIRNVETTAANEADVTIAPLIIPDAPGEVYGDKGL